MAGRYGASDAPRIDAPNPLESPAPLRTIGPLRAVTTPLGDVVAAPFAVGADTGCANAALRVTGGGHFTARVGIGVCPGSAVAGLEVAGDVVITATKKLYLDGGGDTYLYEQAANVIQMFAGGVLTLALSGGNTSIPATGKLYLDGGSDTYFIESAANTIDIVAGGTTRIQLSTILANFVNGVDLAIPTTKKLYLDGGVDTYIIESSANTVKVFAGAVESFRMTDTFTFSPVDFIVNPTIKIRLDGSTVGDTYVSESVANTIRFVAGGANSLAMNATKVVVPSGVGFYLDDGSDTYLIETSANQIDIFAGAVNTIRTTTSLVSVLSVDFAIPATKKSYLDGGGNTYLTETSADQIDIFANATNIFRMTAANVTVLNANLIIPAAKNLYLDGGNDTYIQGEVIANTVSIICNSTSAFVVSVSGSSPDTQLGSSTTTASAANLRMASTGLQTLLVNTSLRAVKTNIKDMTLEDARRLMFGLRPIFFNSLCKEDDPDIIHPGLIAEDVLEVDSRFNTFYKDQLTSVYYERLALPLYPIARDHEARLRRLEDNAGLA